MRYIASEARRGITHARNACHVRLERGIVDFFAGAKSYMQHDYYGVPLVFLILATLQVINLINARSNLSARRSGRNSGWKRLLGTLLPGAWNSTGRHDA